MIWVDGIVPMFCGQAMVTESGERSGESGREEVGRWGLSTLLSSLEIFHWHFCYLALLPPYCLTTLPHYNLTILPPYHLTTLQPYHLTTLPSYNLTTLPLYHLTTWPPDHQEKKCQWKKRSMSSALLRVPAGDSVLLCLVYTIVLSYMIVAYYIIIWYINYQALIALIFFCITAVWWHFFLKFSKHCLYLNISLSLLALYIDVEVFLQYALGQWVKRWLIANISLVFACISVFKGRAVVLDNCCPLGVVGLCVSKQLS